MDNNELVICQGLTKNYGKKTALNNLNLTLGRGQFIGLLGPNGSGKTTTIKLLNGLLQPTSGSVLIDGQAPGTYTHSIISYLPDKNYLNDAMKVNDLISFFADFYTDFDRVKANDMLDSLGIDPLNRLKTLSKGNQEKVQLILTMSRKAQLYVLDEPIAGVDPAARDYILSTILSNYSEDASVLLSTHLIADVERVIRRYPWSETIFREISTYVNKPEEVIHMFSEALKIADKNTVKYMIEELQDELQLAEKKQKQEAELRKQEEEKRKQAEDELQRSKEEIAQLKALLAKKQ